MKMINNIPLRQAEQLEEVNKGPLAILQKRREEAERLKEDLRQRTIKVICDYRILGQLNPLINDMFGFRNIDGMFVNEINVNRENFLRDAIYSRNILNEIYVEPFEYRIYDENHNCISIECEKDLIEQLHKEAATFGLTLNEYARAILYTTALNMNQERMREAEEKERERKENELYPIGQSYISQELKRKLEGKFGIPQMFYPFSLPVNTYTDMLIEISNEYFGID